MGFLKKTWVDRISEYPARRRLKKSDGTEEVVTVSREEGTISKEGDAFSAQNMNDLETRVSDAFDEVNNSLEKIGFYNSANGKEVSVPNNKNTVIQSLTLTEGVWDIVCDVVEPTGFNSNYLIGIRGICSVACPSFSGFVTPTRQFHKILKLTIPTTIAIYVHHTKGSAANFKSTIYAVRIN